MDSTALSAESRASVEGLRPRRAPEVLRPPAPRRPALPLAPQPLEEEVPAALQAALGTTLPLVWANIPSGEPVVLHPHPDTGAPALYLNHAQAAQLTAQPPDPAALQPLVEALADLLPLPTVPIAPTDLRQNLLVARPPAAGRVESKEVQVRRQQLEQELAKVHQRLQELGPTDWAAEASKLGGELDHWKRYNLWNANVATAVNDHKILHDLYREARANADEVRYLRERQTVLEGELSELAALRAGLPPAIPTLTDMRTGITHLPEEFVDMSQGETLERRLYGGPGGEDFVAGAIGTNGLWTLTVYQHQPHQEWHVGWARQTDWAVAKFVLGFRYQAPLLQIERPEDPGHGLVFDPTSRTLTVFLAEELLGQMLRELRQWRWEFDIGGHPFIVQLQSLPTVAVDLRRALLAALEARDRAKVQELMGRLHRLSQESPQDLWEGLSLSTRPASREPQVGDLFVATGKSGLGPQWVIVYEVKPHAIFGNPILIRIADGRRGLDTMPHVRNLVDLATDLANDDARLLATAAELEQLRQRLLSAGQAAAPAAPVDHSPARQALEEAL